MRHDVVFCRTTRRTTGRAVAPRAHRAFASRSPPRRPRALREYRCAPHARQMAAQGSEAAAPVAEAPKEEELCVACSEAPRTVLLTACGHRSLCGPCFSRMANMPFNPDRPAACPLCRTPIVGAGFKRTREGESLPSFEAAAVEPAQVARVERFVRTGASNKGRLGCHLCAHLVLTLLAHSPVARRKDHRRRLAGPRRAVVRDHAGRRAG